MQKIPIILCLCFALFLPATAMAEDFRPKILRVCSPEIIKEELNDVHESALNTLRNAGFDLTTQTLPNKRSRMKINQGNCDLITIAHADTFQPDDPVIKIEPALLKLSFWLIVRPGRHELCEKNTQEFKQYSVVGIRGVELYEHFIYPYFGRHEVVSDVKKLHAMLDLRRADFSALPQKVITESLKPFGLRVHQCDKPPLVELKFHSFLNKAAVWAKPAIESSYSDTFSQIVEEH